VCKEQSAEPVDRRRHDREARLDRRHHPTPGHPLAHFEVGQLARLVLEQEPVFQPVAPLVELVCQHPWRIRRPRDLAQHTGIRLGSLKRQLAELGFHRVEHFIVCVRMVALEQLMTREPVEIAEARWRVGIGDTTNARRQLRRAKKSSKDAFLKLRSLVA